MSIIKRSVDNIAGLVAALNNKVDNDQVLTNVPANAVFTDTNTWRDVVDTLTSVDTTKSLTAKQGKVLKDLIDVIDTKLDNLNYNMGEM